MKGCKVEGSEPDVIRNVLQQVPKVILQPKQYLLLFKISHNILAYIEILFENTANEKYSKYSKRQF